MTQKPEQEPRAVDHVHPRELSISDHTYELPFDRIAQRPLEERDASKLLVHRSGVISDHVFRELPDLLPEGSMLVLNRTKVVNARIIMHRKSGARIELLCSTPGEGQAVEQAFARTGECVWICFIGNAKRWKIGEVLSMELEGTALKAERIGGELVRFSWEPADRTFAEVLGLVGHVPLPPYIDRPDGEEDRTRYNTVFGEQDGSVAAPTASLHFTDAVLERIRERGIRRAELVLHVGAGTFLPVKTQSMADHVMHHEQVRIPLEALQALQSQLGHGPIIAVGTTALRTLESIYWHGLGCIDGSSTDTMRIDQWEPYRTDRREVSVKEALEAVVAQVEVSTDQTLVGTTGLLIAPGYTFRFAQGLITNFHQPGSTLLLLVDAFLGRERERVYAHALANDYRFLSYGDASLLLRC